MSTTHESYPHRAISTLNYQLPGEGNDEGDNAPLLALYALLAITKGRQTTLEDVHDAWSLWTVLTRGRLDHRCLVPFEELALADQDLKRPYLAAIHETARRLEQDGIPYAPEGKGEPV